MEKNGIDKERLQLAWISAAEGEKFAKTVKHMEEIMTNVSKEDLEKSQNWAKGEIEKLEKRKEKMKKKKKKADDDKEENSDN
jgi:heterodisulfide reductase subunit A